MIISHSKRFIFIHNYKVAGTSIRKVLKPYSNYTFKDSSLSDKIKIRLKIYPNIYGIQFDHHGRASAFKDKIPSKYFNSYFKFGFVRNPWDWQVSLYLYMLKETNHPQHSLAKSFKNFKDYLQWRVNKEVRLQKSFFYDEEGNKLVDFIGKFENIEDDFRYVCNKVGIQVDLPHLNRSRKGNSYLDFYDADTIQMVNDHFYEDIQLFEYKLPRI